MTAAQNLEEIKREAQQVRENGNIYKKVNIKFMDEYKILKAESFVKSSLTDQQKEKYMLFSFDYFVLENMKMVSMSLKSLTCTDHIQRQKETHEKITYETSTNRKSDNFSSNQINVVDLVSIFGCYWSQCYFFFVSNACFY